MNLLIFSVILALGAVCISAQRGSEKQSQPMAVDMELMGSDYERTTEAEANRLSEDVESVMNDAGLKVQQVEVGPSDPPTTRALRWRIRIRIRIWIVTVEIEISGGRKKRSAADDIQEQIRRAIEGRRGMIGNYQVDTSSIVMNRGSSSTMEVPLYDVEYTDDMADESSDSYQRIASPIYELMDQRHCFLRRCPVRIIIVYCYPYVRVIVVHCHYYHLWWLRSQIGRHGALGDYKVNTDAISISNE